MLATQPSTTLGDALNAGLRPRDQDMIPIATLFLNVFNEHNKLDGRS
jgi:hypothetical protein